MFFMLIVFACALPVGAAFAWLCRIIGQDELIKIFITAVVAIIALIAVGLMATSAGDPQVGFVAIQFLLIFVGPPIAGFAVGAFGFGGLAKYMPSRG